VEITLSSGDKHVIERPDHATLHPKTGHLIIFPDDFHWPSIPHTLPRSGR
jgi:hypothetical protein